MSKTNMNEIYSLSDLISVSNHLGSKWFKPETLKFWHSRNSETIYRVGPLHGYFVSSENNFDGSKRLYTVRYYSVVVSDSEEMSENDEHEMSIGNHSEFQQYETRAQAHGAARRALRESLWNGDTRDGRAVRPERFNA